MSKNGKIICAACNITLLCAAIAYGSYYLYQKYHPKEDDAEKKAKTEGLVEEPAEAPAPSA